MAQMMDGKGSGVGDKTEVAIADSTSGRAATGVPRDSRASTGVADHPLEQTELRRSQDIVGNCPPAGDVWLLSGSVLNAFWRHCFPRLVAKFWLDPASVTSLSNPSTAITPKEPTMVKFLNDLAADVDALPINSPKFAQKKQLVVAYLTSSTSNRIPIRFISGGGFDYVLSEWGLDLFSPPAPKTEADLYDFYTYRATSTPAIGIPFYMTEAVGDAYIDPDADQARITLEKIVEMLHAGAGAGYLSDDRAAKTIASLQKAAAQPEVDEHPAGIDRDSDRSGTTARKSPGNGIDGRNIDPTVNLKSLKAVLKSVRCWQIDGADLRGIQTQLPRVVAKKWFEQAVGSADPNAYARRIHQPDGLRRILNERLELSLPAAERMRFEMRPRPGSSDTIDNEIVVTDKGFLFPYAADLAELPDPTQRPSVDRRVAILEAIVVGAAGNPVFTDSMPCE